MADMKEMLHDLKVGTWLLAEDNAVNQELLYRGPASNKEAAMLSSLV